MGDAAMKPSKIIRWNVAITSASVFSDAPLQCALLAIDDALVMFSIDALFEDMSSTIKWFATALHSDTTREKMFSGNLSRMLKL